jgi:hypothetical protein
VGHTEAVVSGSLAGMNAARQAGGLGLITLPRTLASGDIIATAGEVLRGGDLSQKLTFSGATYFKRMVEAGLYSTDRAEIHARVAAAGLDRVYASGVSA